LQFIFHSENYVQFQFIGNLCSASAAPVYCGQKKAGLENPGPLEEKEQRKAGVAGAVA